LKTTVIACLCGAVKVRLRSEPLDQFYCHCDDCQAVSGGAYVSVAIFPDDAVKVIQGSPVTWKYKVLPRQRCAACGTQLMAEVPGADQIGVKANLLPAGMFRPAFHIHRRFAVLPIQDDLPHFRELPARFGGSDATVDW
jgi:hypothetical protein